MTRVGYLQPAFKIILLHAYTLTVLIISVTNDKYTNTHANTKKNLVVRPHYLERGYFPQSFIKCSYIYRLHGIKQDCLPI